MYDFHISDMTRAIKKELGLDRKQVNEVRKVLDAYWADKIAITWTIGDVLSVVDSLHIKLKLSNEEAFDILQTVLHHHDATIGITWDTIENEVTSRMP